MFLENAHYIKTVYFTSILSTWICLLVPFSMKFHHVQLGVGIERGFCIKEKKSICKYLCLQELSLDGFTMQETVPVGWPQGEMPQCFSLQTWSLQNAGPCKNEKYVSLSKLILLEGCGGTVGFVVLFVLFSKTDNRRRKLAVYSGKGEKKKTTVGILGAITWWMGTFLIFCSKHL